MEGGWALRGPGFPAPPTSSCRRSVLAAGAASRRMASCAVAAGRRSISSSGRYAPSRAFPFPMRRARAPSVRRRSRTRLPMPGPAPSCATATGALGSSTASNIPTAWKPRPPSPAGCCVPGRHRGRCRYRHSRTAPQTPSVFPPLQSVGGAFPGARGTHGPRQHAGAARAGPGDAAAGRAFGRSAAA